MSGTLENWRRRRAEKRVTPGDGRPLQAFRWWQSLTRALFYLRLTNNAGEQNVYAVDVRHWGNSSGGEVRAHLYLDGRQHAVSRIPSIFNVGGGTVEVAMSAFGLKRCHYVSAAGLERQLTPDPASAEGRRAKLDRGYPALSRGIGVVSLIVLVIGLMALITQVIPPLTQLPLVAEHIGTFISPINLPVWLNIVIAILVGAASTERAMRLRYNIFLDGGAG